MWGYFAIDLVAALVLIYVPGLLFCRGLRFRGLLAVACAPVISVAAYSVLSVAYGIAGISCNELTVFGVVLLMSFVSLVVSGRAKGDRSLIVALPGKSAFTFRDKELSFDGCVAAAYLCVAVIVCAVLFLGNLGSASNFFCRWDNQTHMNLVRSFVNSGLWSSLTTTVYADAAANAIPYLSQPSFYPAAWHDLVALDVSLTASTCTVAINAVNVALVVSVLPLGMCALMRAVFPDDRLTVAVGSLLTMSFAALPWAFFVKGPLYPNLLGLVMVPAIAAALISFIERGLLLRKPVAAVSFGAASFCALALAHPNCLFALFVLIAPYIGHRIAYSCDHGNGTLFKSKSICRAVPVGVFALACCVFWLFCYKLPFLQGIIQYSAGGNQTVLMALAVFGSISFPTMRPEPLVMLASIIGLVHCLRTRRLWVLFPPVYMAVTYVVTLSTHAPIQHLLAGFWYCDHYRIGAFLALFLVPISSIGLATAIRFIVKKVEDKRVGPTAAASYASGNMRNYVLTGAAVAVFAIGTFLPFVSIPGTDLRARLGFGYLNDRLNGIYTSEVEQVYSFEERAFVDEVVELIGEDELVINMPQDGSVFAYSANDLDAYYRKCRAGDQTDDGKAIRKGLYHYASDENVQHAVSNTGAEYVLLLDDGVSYEDGVWMQQYKNPEDWVGITSINDETPGFTIVLSEGDMRLFRIDAVDAE